MRGEKKPYRVGYGKPPREHQFQPGHRGFGKRGPRKRKTLAEEVKAVLAEPMTINLGGKPRRVSTMTAMLLQLCAKGMKGDLPSTRLLLTFAQASDAEQPEQAISDLLADDLRLLAELTQRGDPKADDDGE